MSLDFFTRKSNTITSIVHLIAHSHVMRNNHVVLRHKQWNCLLTWSFVPLRNCRKSQHDNTITTKKKKYAYNKYEPSHNSSAEQSVEQHHGMAVPRGRNGHHAMACVDIYSDPIHPSWYLPRNLVQIP